MTSQMKKTTLDVQSISATSYRAGPKARGFKRTHRKRALHEPYRICRVIVGIANRICGKEGLIGRLPYQPQKAECRDCHVSIPSPENGRVYRLVR